MVTIKLGPMWLLQSDPCLLLNLVDYLQIILPLSEFFISGLVKQVLLYS